MKPILFLATFTFATVPFLSAQKPVIRAADLSHDELTKVQAILEDADPSTYNLTVEEGGKAVRLGSASLRGLRTASAYHKVGASAKAGNEIVTTISDYVKTIWTSAFATKYPDKVKQINELLEAGAARVAVVKPTISKATFESGELEKIQAILKDADPSTYNLSVEQGGKATRLGSASIRTLSTVSAYHKLGAGAKAGNEIVTTISDYVKTIWTSAFAAQYPDKVLAINKIMESAAKR